MRSKRAQASLMELAEAKPAEVPQPEVAPPVVNTIREERRSKLALFERDPAQVEWILTQLDQAEFFGLDSPRPVTIPLNLFLALMACVPH